MWKCPVCRQENENTFICPKCGFDESLNYNKYFMVARLSEEEMKGFGAANSSIKPKKKKGLVIFFVGVVFLFVLLNILRVEWLQSGNRSEETVSGDTELSVMEAAEQGDAEAQYTLGTLYDTGTGVEEDDAEAVKWYRKAAEQGNKEAQYKLGNMYKNGDGVEKNVEEAIKWYQKAAEGEE